jgi:DNA primase
MRNTDLTPIKKIPILDVAGQLDLPVRGKKAMCFGGHDRQTPSLSFVLGKNTWKCYGCGKFGDAISLVREVLGCDFKTTLDWFANEMRVDVRQDGSRRRSGGKVYAARKPSLVSQTVRVKPEEKNAFSADPELYSWMIDKCGAVSQVEGLQYLESHGITPDAASRFGLRELRNPSRAFQKLVERWGAERVFRSGLAWGKDGNPERLIWTSYAILFPFCVNEKVEYIQGRLFQGTRKYLNPRGIDKPLYNVEQASALSAGSVVHLCEGVPDAIALETRKFHAVAVLGASSFRAAWVDVLKRLDIVLVPDGDKGGETFQRTVAGFFKARGKSVRTVRMPQGKDVADVIAEMGSARE